MALNWNHELDNGQLTMTTPLTNHVFIQATTQPDNTFDMVMLYDNNLLDNARRDSMIEMETLAQSWAATCQ